MKKVSVFVDVQNIYYTTKQQFNSNFDYNKFWKRVTHQRKVVGAFAYATSRGDAKQIQFQNILRAIGFEVKLKPFINRQDGSSKGDWDVGITIDILDYAKKVEKIILLSGDGDFDLLVGILRNDFDVSAEVYGVVQLTARPLINSASKFMPIENDLLLQ